ncbi:hypothetical protein V6N13_004803 [Hibiscus sabdariffa]|uniref:Uncharacterized protein n=1 Tax=Hibiscus sabdariffa TaxID=183260 RepID=A0ABR2S0B1_9ROSI
MVAESKEISGVKSMDETRLVVHEAEGTAPLLIDMLIDVFGSSGLVKELPRAHKSEVFQLDERSDLCLIAENQWWDCPWFYASRDVVNDVLVKFGLVSTGDGYTEFNVDGVVCGTLGLAGLLVRSLLALYVDAMGCIRLAFGWDVMELVT